MTDTDRAESSLPPIVPPSLGDTVCEIATEKLTGRQRRLSASILVPCSMEHLWDVLTDYDNLASIVPNLTLSRRINSADTATLLEQVGSQCFLNIKFCARVVLQMVEHFPHQLNFTMVEGDFKTFEGAWKLEPADETQGLTRLVYELFVCPPKAVPGMMIERHLRRDLSQNLQAIRQHAIATAVVS